MKDVNHKAYTEKELVELIDNAIISIWKKDIPHDYKQRYLLREDTLKNAMYHHLRNKLGPLFEANDIRIFTEFTDCEFQNRGYRPDIVIAKVDMSNDVDYWGKTITRSLAVLELKYKQGSNSAIKSIEADYSKMKQYISDLKIECRLYMATILEQEREDKPWLNNEPVWAKGRLTELNASYDCSDSDLEMRFYVHQH